MSHRTLVRIAVLLHDYVRFLHNNAPLGSWGSAENYRGALLWRNIMTGLILALSLLMPAQPVTVCPITTAQAEIGTQICCCETWNGNLCCNEQVTCAGLVYGCPQCN